MDWLKDLANTARTKLGELFPALSPVDAARDFISEAVAHRIREEACSKAYALLAQAHSGVIRTIVWQNATLLASLGPVYFLHSPYPFYLAYTGVAGYSLYTVAKSWPLVLRLFKTRSITRTLSREVLESIDMELTQRQFYERKVVEWLGPDLKHIADDVARRLKPDVVAAVGNMAATLVLSFIAFRMFAIPLLEHRALQ